MTLSRDPGSAAKQPRRIEKDLRKLHRRGLVDPRLDDLGALVGIARALSDESGDPSKLKSVLARAIDACWAGDKDQRDAVRLWFGLPALNTQGAPDTRAMTSTERHSVAAQHWGREAESTFRTSGAERRYRMLAVKLVELAETADAPTPIDDAPLLAGQPETLLLPPQSPPTGTSGETEDRSTQRAKRLALRHLRLRAVLGLLVIVGLAVWAWWPSSGQSIPPLGAVVNAETGKVSLYVPPTGTQLPGQIQAGPIFRACNIETEHPCKWRSSPFLINAHVGSVIEFSVQLHNPSGVLVPYLHLRALWQAPEGLTATEPLSTLEMVMNVHWPIDGEESFSEPTTEHRPAYRNGYVSTSMGVHFPYSGIYGFTYIPGSSELLGRRGELIHYLPNGIMGYGIALQDVGPPPTCNDCSDEYTRYVNFRARVVAHE